MVNNGDRGLESTVKFILTVALAAFLVYVGYVLYSNIKSTTAADMACRSLELK